MWLNKLVQRLVTLFQTSRAMMDNFKSHAQTLNLDKYFSFFQLHNNLLWLKYQYHEVKYPKNRE